jgi:penicillin-binding protein 2
MNNSSALHNYLDLKRILVFGGIVILVSVIYVGRLFYLQIMQYDDWVAQAADNRTHEINIAAPRGIIYDRNGVVLARNIPSFNIVITPADLPDDISEIQNIYHQLSLLTGVPVNLGEVSLDTPYAPCQSEHGITQITEYGETSAPFEPVRIACDVDREVAMVIEENAVHWPGAGVEVEPVREYPTGSLTAATVGFLGPIPAIDEEYYLDLGFVPNRDKVGYAGVELYFQDELAGDNGLRVVEWDVAGKVLRDLLPPESPSPGNNIRLTIDTRLQLAVESILIDEINSWNRYFGEERMTSGVVIALNPQTGEILSMISYPTYENNRMARIIPA